MSNSSSGILSPMDIIKFLFKELSIVLPKEYKNVVLFFPLVLNFNPDFLMHIIYFMQIMDM